MRGAEYDGGKKKKKGKAFIDERNTMRIGACGSVKR